MSKVTEPFLSFITVNTSVLHIPIKTLIKMNTSFMIPGDFIKKEITFFSIPIRSNNLSIAKSHNIYSFDI